MGFVFSHTFESFNIGLTFLLLSILVLEPVTVTTLFVQINTNNHCKEAFFIYFFIYRSKNFQRRMENVVHLIIFIAKIHFFS